MIFNGELLLDMQRFIDEANEADNEPTKSLRELKDWAVDLITQIQAEIELTENAVKEVIKK